MRIELNQVYNMDCIKGMNLMAEQGMKVNFICCDLPFGVTHNAWDRPIPFDQLWECYHKIMHDRTCVALFGQGRYFIDLVESNRDEFRYDLVWDKQLTTGFLNANRMPLRQHEQIAIFYKKLPKYNPQMTVGAKLHGRGNPQKNTNRNYGFFERVENRDSNEKYPTSIIRIAKRHPSQVIHPTEKPIELIENLIKTYTDAGDIVIDNCMGSFTTAEACRNLERVFLGFENDSQNYEIGQKRMRR